MRSFYLQFANFGLQTGINIFIRNQRLESKNLVYMCFQTYLTTYSFLENQVFKFCHPIRVAYLIYVISFLYFLSCVAFYFP